ncbi:hypothetical protein SAMN04487943_101331 [Gracilibacillus orientalis]|uniref:Uncharacterized protein n=1 Tax=Gracilibacillus orientalis TaxID=334253 RepID=A0A1I4HCX0_9BACI|nr:hypothetical protein [Gracilibacillus orientalis]SFL39457.1 hypothetical protein SAMN04487943_101331 [Gracilibacillus orientalis]
MGNLADVEQTASIINNAIRDLPDTFNKNKNEVSQLENEIQDLLHVIEFSSFNAHEGWKLSKQLKKARTKRRTLKNENEQIEPLLSFCKKTRNYLGELDDVIQDIHQVKKNQKNRTYRCRVLEDLQNKF